MSANTRAPSTIVTIALTGQTEFNIPFEYLARKYVEVTLLGIDRLPLVLNTDFRFVTKTLISLTRPYTSEYTQIELRRVTSATERLVDFHDGSILRAYDLNLSQIQTLHVAEEARDLTADTIGVNDEGHLDARNRKIVNLAYAENGSDAIPLGQVIQWNDSAYNSANRAEAERIAAEAARDAAHLSEVATAADAVATAADRVVTQADADITTQNAASTSADRVDVTTKYDDVVVKHDEIMGVIPKLDDAVQQMTGLGNVPVGVVAMTMTPHVPAGWLRCGEPFDKTTYPALAKLYPSGVTPSMDERFAKGVSRADRSLVGEHGAQSLPLHSHTVPSQGLTGESAIHDHGTVGGSTSVDGDHTHGYHAPLGGGSWYSGASSWNEANPWAQTAAAGAHSHSVSVHVGAHSHGAGTLRTVESNTLESGDGSALEPAHTNVWYIIKAAEGIADKDEAMQVVGTVVGRVDAAEAEIATLKTRVAALEHYPKVIKLSDIFEGTSVWRFSDSEFNVIEHKDYYHIQGIFWTISGGGAAGTLGTFKHDVRFSFAPCGVSENPSSATAYAYISRGWTGADYGRSIELVTNLQNISWVMSSFVVIKGP